MTTTPTIRELEQGLEALRVTSGDSLQRAQVLASVRLYAAAMQSSVARAIRFADAGLLAEASSVVHDFPDLLMQAEHWSALLHRRDLVGDVAREGATGIAPPTPNDRDRLEQITVLYAEREVDLRAYRTACLEGEGPSVMRQRLRKLMHSDGNAGAWAEQLAVVEREWADRVKRGMAAHIADDDLLEFAREGKRGGWAARVEPGFLAEVEARAAPIRVAHAARRYDQMLASLEAAHAAQDAAAVDRIEHAWASWQQDCGEAPPAPAMARAMVVFGWAAEVAAQQERGAAHARALDELDLMLLDESNPARVLTAWTRIEDSALPVPDGLNIRALRYIQAHDERKARKHRLQVVGVVAAVLVLGSVLALAVTAYHRASERQSAVDALLTAVGESDRDRAVALAAALETARPTDRHVAEQGAIDAARALDARIQGLDQRADRAMAGVDAAAAPDSPLAAVRGVEDSIRAVLVEPGLPAGTKGRLELALRRCTDRREQIASGHDAIAREAMGRADDAFRLWPPIARWSAVERVDRARLARCSDEMNQLVAVLEAAQSKVKETDRATKRLESDLAAAKERLAAATARERDLTTALSRLNAGELAKETSGEQQFIDRVHQWLVGSDGVLLGDLGLRAAFEESDQCDDAYQALADWRESLRPTLLAQLGDGLEAPDDGAVAQKAILELDTHLRRFPESPLRASLEGLRDTMDPTKRGLVASVGDIHAALEQQGIAGLEVVNIAPPRYFYRRIEAQGGPLRGGLQSASDLSQPADKLGTVKGVSGKDVRGAPLPSPVSERWAEGTSRLNGAKLSSVVPAIERMLISIAAVKANAPGNDSLMQLSVLIELTRIATEDLGQPIDADRSRELKEWLAVVRERNAGLMSVDWVKVCHTPMQGIEQMRREAAELVEAFPLRGGATLRPKSQQFGGLETAYAPIGVMMPAGARDAARDVVLWRPTETAWAVARSLGRSTLVPVRVTGKKASDVGLGLPRGPVLLFGGAPAARNP